MLHFLLWFWQCEQKRVCSDKDETMALYSTLEKWYKVQGLLSVAWPKTTSSTNSTGWEVGQSNINTLFPLWCSNNFKPTLSCVLHLPSVMNICYIVYYKRLSKINLPSFLQLIMHSNKNFTDAIEPGVLSKFAL